MSTQVTHFHTGTQNLKKKKKKSKKEFQEKKYLIVHINTSLGYVVPEIAGNHKWGIGRLALGGG